MVGSPVKAAGAPKARSTSLPWTASPRAIGPKQTTLNLVTDRCTHGVGQGGSTDGHMIAVRAIG